MKTRLGLVVLLVGAAASAQAPDEVAAARERISSGRNAAEAEYAVREKACYQRFAVNDCVQAARTERRATLAELRREEITLNDAERRRKAAERLRSLQERAAERARSVDSGPAGEAAARQQTREAAAAQTQAARAPAVTSRSAPPDAAAAPPPGSAAAGSPPPAAPAVPAARAASAGSAATAKPPPDSAAQVLRHQKKVEEAQARKERVTRKLLERTEPPAAPLPTP